MVLNNLRAIREGKSLTAAELAMLTLMTERNVQGIEKGRGTTLNTAKRLAKALKVKVADLQ